jgi:hypothetical protein
MVDDDDDIEKNSKNIKISRRKTPAANIEALKYLGVPTSEKS